MKQLLIFTLLFCFTLTSFGCDEHYEHIAGEHGHSLLPSGREGDDLEKTKEAVRLIFGENGVAEKLGLANPKHEFSILKSAKLAALASIGRYPMPHWTDGRTIMGSNAVGVLEFYIGTCETCRSFYADTNPISGQISILAHVAGHVDFGKRSPFNGYRSKDNDIVFASLKLAELVRDYSLKHGNDEVLLFIQYLNSFTYAQDIIIDGNFDHPDTLKPTHKNKRHPERPTTGILQYLVSNMPANAPQWKKELVKWYEKSNRFVGITKIQNEGWATFNQRLIVKHYPGYDDHLNFEQGLLLAGVKYPKLDNPYWLGYELWDVLYQRYRKENGAGVISELELDQGFVKYAQGWIERGLSDYQFIIDVLADNPTWLRKYGFQLERNVTSPEHDPSLPPSKDPKKTQQKIVVSSDPRRVAIAIARKAADYSTGFPLVSVVAESGYGSNKMVLRHKIIKDIPLEIQSAAQTLFILGQVKQKTIVLETIAAYEKPFHYEEVMEELIVALGSKEIAEMYWDHYGMENIIKYFLPHLTKKLQIIPIVLEVEPGGNMAVFQKIDNTENPLGFDLEVIPGLTMRAKAAVDYLKVDLEETVDKDLFVNNYELFKEQGDLVSKVVDTQVQAPVSQLNQTPGMAEAILKLAGMIENRAHRSMKRLLEGKDKVKRSGGGIALKVFPSIPSFSLDQSVVQKRAKGAPITNPDFLKSQNVLGMASPGARVEYKRGGFPTFYERVLVRKNGRLIVEEYENTLKNNEIRAQILELSSSKETRVRLKKLEDKLLITKIVLDNEIKNTRVQSASAKGYLPDEDLDLGIGSGMPGDRKWGPGQGGGQGNDPGQKPGEEPLDPSEIVLPPELWGDFLANELELPNLRPKDGQSPVKEIRKLGTRKHTKGSALYEKMAATIVAKGKIYLESKERFKEARNVHTCFREGLKLITPEDKVVRGYTEVKTPEINAVVYYLVDKSGSMWKDGIKAAHDLTWNFSTFLRAKYKKVEIRYIAVDTRPTVFESEEEFFKTNLGGGTNYIPGIKKLSEEFEQFPENKWDRFAVVVGDSGHFGEVSEVARDLKILSQEVTQHTSYFHVNMGWPEELQGALKALSGEEEFFDYTEIEPNIDSVMGGLKDIYGKDKNKD